MPNSSRFLGGMEANEFLANYWQKQPLLIPGALAELPALSADELAGLALETEIESRLILEHPSSSNWELHHGPFTEQRLQSLPNSHWTLLVQAVDQWLPDVHDLLESFNFLPRWRLDDIMVSCAADQGSVGPHFDSYNVFLLQTAGRKRWRIGQYCGADTELVVNSPLRLLSEFEQQEEYLLEPGDMLYLPPRIAHWGVSEGESMTFSIGFRSPTAVELLNDLATELLSEPEFASKVFNDPPLSTDLARGVIDPVFIEATRDLLISQLSDDALLARWFARFMTTRKYPDLELITDKHKLPWQLALARGEQLAWHPASRCAAITPNVRVDQAPGQTLLAVDGEIYPATFRLASLLSEHQQFSQQDMAKLSTEETTLVDQLVDQGSLQIIDGTKE